MQSEERPIEIDPHAAQASMRLIAHVHREGHRWNLVHHARRVHRCQQSRVVVELVTARANASDAVSEQQSARIGRISPPLVDAGGEGDHGGAERIGQDDRAAESSLLQESNAIAGLAVPGDHPAERTDGGQQRGQMLRRGDGDSTLAAEPMVQGSVGGESEDVVADPIETDYDSVTRHSLLRFQSLSTGHASITKARGAARCGEKSRR